MKGKQAHYPMMSTYFDQITLDPSTTSHFIVAILIERGAFCVPFKVSRETL
ncbi:hypothetical protein EDB71_113104 [Vibrio crassostreae]|nr:hypothetical protein EDB71_113104 [Vibrio crassostreae]